MNEELPACEAYEAQVAIPCVQLRTLNKFIN